MESQLLAAQYTDGRESGDWMSINSYYARPAHKIYADCGPCGKTGFHVDSLGAPERKIQ